MTRPCDEAAVRRLTHLHGRDIEQLTGVPIDRLPEIEERIAIEQESSGAEIDVVRRDTRTGERITTTEVRQ